MAQTTDQGKNTPPAKAEKKQNPFYKRLHEMPQILGIIAMVVILVAAVYVGNWRTLNNLVQQAEATLDTQDMADGIAQRIAAAQNLLEITSRYSGVSQDRINNVENAIAALQKGDDAQSISTADQSLKTAMDVLYSELRSQSDFATGKYSSDTDNASSAMLQFAEAGNIMWQQARNYNRQIENAQNIYRQLPFRALLAQPQEYKQP